MSKYFDPEQGWAPDKKDAEEMVHPKCRTLRDTVLIEGIIYSVTVTVTEKI